MAYTVLQTCTFLCFFSYQVVAEAVDMVELSVSEAESPTDSEPLTEIVLHGK